MAKVLLIQPNNDIRKREISAEPFTPLSLIYLATVIEDKHSVKIYDRNLNVNDFAFLDFLRKYNPDIVGFTSNTSEVLFDIILLGKLIKKEFPKLLIVVGGPHATIEPDSVLNEPYVDYIIRGEGEEAFLEFCDTFDKNPKKLKILKNINHNLLRPYLNMNNLKIPNYGLLDLKKYKIFYVSMNRGCPGNCTFCYNVRSWGKNGKAFVRTFSLEKSKELFKQLAEKYHFKVFSIVDDHFISNKPYAIELCTYLKNFNFHFFCFGRADYVDDEILKALKKAGCHTIQIGIESGSPKILNFLNKQVTVEQNRKAIECCRRNNIICDASFMLGLPIENIFNMKETVDFIKKTKPDIINLKIYDPLPGAIVFDFCISKGSLVKPQTLEDWASWTGNMSRVNHNVSQVSDEMILKTAEEVWKVNFYKTKFKKLIFWFKIGEYIYALKGIKRLFFDRNRIRIPFIGHLNLIKKKKEIKNY